MIQSLGGAITNESRSELNHIAFKDINIMEFTTNNRSIADGVAVRVNCKRDSVGSLNDTTAEGNNAAETAMRVKPVIDRTAAQVHHAVDSSAKVAEQAADWLATKAKTLELRQKNLTDDACKFVSAHPVKSMLLAIGTGLLLGRFFR